MPGKGTDLAASVLARLLNRAKQTGDDYQTLLTSYCYERFLYRLGVSALRDRFVLKGAMLLRVWSRQPYRATRDLDLLHRGPSSFEDIEKEIKEVSETTVEPDGVLLVPSSIRVVAIRAEDEYAGTRVTMSASCGSARLMFQIDIGVGDAVWPIPKDCHYPTLLDSPAPSVLANPREAVIAEELEAMVVLGDRNSRIKDFFDVYHLASECEFDQATLVEAVRKTSARRQTPIPKHEPIALTAAYRENPARPAQVRAFARRAGFTPDLGVNEGFLDRLRSFLLPLLKELRRSQSGQGHRAWRPGGPWT